MIGLQLTIRKGQRVAYLVCSFRYVVEKVLDHRFEFDVRVTVAFGGALCSNASWQAHTMIYRGH